MLIRPNSIDTRLGVVFYLVFLQGPVSSSSFSCGYCVVYSFLYMFLYSFVCLFAFIYKERLESLFSLAQAKRI